MSFPKDARASLARTGIVLTLLCAASATASAQDWEPTGGVSTAEPTPLTVESYEPPPRPAGPFDRGRFRVGAGLGWADGVDTGWLILSLGGGYFVVDGLELGLDAGFWVIGDPFVSTLTPGVRYVFHFVPFVKPYVGTFYKRYFITQGLDDSNSLGLRGGVNFMLGRDAYLGLGVVYERFLDDHLYANANQLYPELSVGFAF